MNISSPSDKFLSVEEEEKYINLNARATNALFNALNLYMVESIMPFEDTHLIWATLKERYTKSKCDVEKLLPKLSFEKCSTSSLHHEEHQMISSLVQEDVTLSSTSLVDKSEQGNDIVSGISKCSNLPLEFDNTTSENSISTSVVNPCISSSAKIPIYHDDMINCPHFNTSISISICETNISKEIETYLRQFRWKNLKKNQEERSI